jgi:hypothetical protein
MIASIAGAAALAAWWVRSRRGTVAEQMASGSRGEVIYSNSPAI